MQRSLFGLARRCSALCATGQRAYASAAELAVAEDSPFLRFASPVPQPTSVTPILSSIPATEVKPAIMCVTSTTLPGSPKFQASQCWLHLDVPFTWHADCLELCLLCV